MRTSVGKAAANALGAWLKQELSADIKVYAHWPNGPEFLGRVVSIIPVGNRVRDDSYGTIEVVGRTDISATEALVQFRQGNLTQPMQLDVWADTDDGRDDVIAQLDDVLHRGLAGSLNVKNSVQTITSDPLNDELSLQMLEDYAGHFAVFQFDEVSIDDDPDSIMRDEYRAILLGQARVPYIFTRRVPRLIAATMKIQATVGFNPSQVGPFDTATLHADTSNPPIVPTPKPTVTYGKSDS